ncbi:MAG: TetR/AcrR family transcriptional regulator [Pseudomonadales bacterium]|nr:TetR/AcrR family transcriptional regulator [Pseudomonadales bacterium]
MNNRSASKREAKLAEILVVATRLFNQRGFLATTMEEIAEALAMNPASLYHYFRGKEELAYQVYVRSCSARRAQLEAAGAGVGSGLARIERFLDNLLTEEHRPALLSEVGALRPEWAEHVRRAQRDNIIAVQSMVADGVRDGSIAPTDPALTGIAVLSIVEWMTFWYSPRLRYPRERIIELFRDVIVNGITPPDARPFEVPVITPAFPPAPAPDPFDREAISALKLERFLKVAMESFNRIGVHATSIDQCARELNLTKGAFYYYFENKEELLYRCYKRALAFNWTAATHLQPRDPVEREVLWRRSLFERHVSEHGPFPTYHHVTFLAPAHRDEIMAELMKQQAADVKIVGDAVEAGFYRRVEPFLAEKVRAGLTNWFPTWYSPAGRATPTEVADNHSRLFLYGLKPRS